MATGHGVSLNKIVEREQHDHVADLIMVLTGLFAAFGTEDTPQKWGWYTIACIAFIFIFWHLGLNGGANARAKGDKLRTFFVSIAAYTAILWTAYPM